MAARPFFRRRGVRVLLCVLGAGVIAVAAAWRLSRRTPDWWREAPLTPRTVESGERLENDVVSELSRARPAEGAGRRYTSGEWTIGITQEEANAWLTTRLKGWVENRGARWPAQVGGVQVAFEEGRVRIGARVMEDGFSRVVSATAVPEVRDGAVWLRASGVAVGGLPLPAVAVLDRFGGLLSGAEVGRIGEVMEGKRAALERAVVRLDDGRVVRVVAVAVKEGSIEVRCRTEKE